MAKSKKKAETIFLVCEETGDYNYTIRRKPGGEKLYFSKIILADFALERRISK